MFAGQDPTVPGSCPGPSGAPLLPLQADCLVNADCCSGSCDRYQQTDLVQGLDPRVGQCERGARVHVDITAQRGLQQCDDACFTARRGGAGCPASVWDSAGAVQHTQYLQYKAVHPVPTGSTGIVLTCLRD